MSERAGPVIKAIGMRISNIEKKVISIDIVRSKSRDRKGLIRKLIIIKKSYISNYFKKIKKSSIRIFYYTKINRIFKKIYYTKLGLYISGIEGIKVLSYIPIIIFKNIEYFIRRFND